MAHFFKKNIKRTPLLSYVMTFESLLCVVLCCPLNRSFVEITFDIFKKIYPKNRSTGCAPFVLIFHPQISPNVKRVLSHTLLFS